jgi:predicted metal-binding membrane protein
MLVGSLAALAALAWLILFWQSRLSMGSEMGPSMGLSAPLFLAIWAAMMVAMMLPAATPMISMFSRISNWKRGQGDHFIPVWIFVAGYLVIWILTGVPAYLAAVLVQHAADRWMWLMGAGPRLAGALIIAAGLYQFSSIKSRCLVKCRSPLGFILTSWRDGRAGALRMGVEHGLFCLGCCWLLFALLFPLGVMNVLAMAAVTVLVLLEKAAPFGRRLSLVAGAVLVCWGLLILVLPAALPPAV